MSSPIPLKRREFIKHAAGLACALAGGGALTSAGAAEAARTSIRTRKDLEKLLPELESQNEKYLNFPRTDGHWLHLLAALSKPRRVLELGTGLGYATLWLATALAGAKGRIVSIEILPERWEVARQYVERAGFIRQVTLLQGDAHELLPGIPGPFELVLLNADKSGNMDYLRKIHPKKLVRGGVMLAYGAASRKEDMKQFLDTMAAHPDFDTVILNTGSDDAFCVSLRY